MAYTLDDFIRLNPNYQKGWDPATKTAYVTHIPTGRQISFGEGQGQQYGIGALQSGPQGSHIIEDPGKLISALDQLSGQSGYQPTVPPKYESPYSEKIGQTLTAIQNRPSFTYDPSKDVGLQSAQQNVMDTVSRAAARRNMLYSESNKSQMGKSALELVPQFEQTAFNRYAQEGQNLSNQLAALQGQETQAYNRYRDTVADVRYGEETAWTRKVADRAFKYQQARDQITDEKGKREFDEAVRQFGLTLALEKAYKLGMLKKKSGTGGYTTSQRIDDELNILGKTGTVPKDGVLEKVFGVTSPQIQQQLNAAKTSARELYIKLKAGKEVDEGSTPEEVKAYYQDLLNLGLADRILVNEIVKVMDSLIAQKEAAKGKGGWFSNPLETFEPPPVM